MSSQALPISRVTEVYTAVPSKQGGSPLSFRASSLALLSAVRGPGGASEITRNEMGKEAQPKRNVYVGGLEEQVNEEILHAAFVPFGDIVEVRVL